VADNLSRDTSADPAMKEDSFAPSQPIWWTPASRRLASASPSRRPLPAAGVISFTHGGSPRIVAGGPISSDVLKCQLKPIDSKDYKVTLTEAERERLSAISLRASVTGASQASSRSSDVYLAFILNSQVQENAVNQRGAGPRPARKRRPLFSLGRSADLPHVGSPPVAPQRPLHSCGAIGGLPRASPTQAPNTRCPNV